MAWKRTLAALAAGLEKFLDRALCVAGAVACAQLPEFMQQYLQRLGGHLDEVRQQIATWRRVAQESGLTLEQLITRYLANADPVVTRGGGVVRDLIARAEELAAAESALRNASLWARPFIFLRHFDWGITHGTWNVFRPAVPTTLEGLAYAVVGVGLALAFYHGAVKWPLERWRAAIESKV